MSSLQPLTLRVASITRETADAVTIYFEDPTGKPLPPYRAGQYLTLILPIPDPQNSGRPVRRAYSLSSAPHENTCAVTVKKVQGGLASEYIVDQLRPGQTLEVLPPLGSFVVPAAGHKQARQFVLIGGGSGITPLLSISKTVLRDEEWGHVLLIYGNRDRESTIFRQQLDELRAQYGDRFEVVHVLEHGPSEYSGRFSSDILKQVLAQKQVPTPVALYFLCGPEGLMNAARAGLEELGVPSAQVLRESFTPSTTPAAPAPVVPEVAQAAGPTTRTVKIHFEGSDYEVAVAPTQSILEAGLDAGIDLPYSCQAGLCTACRGRCLSGAVRMDEREGLSDAEIAKGYVLLCVGHPTTDDVSLEIG